MSLSIKQLSEESLEHYRNQIPPEGSRHTGLVKNITPLRRICGTGHRHRQYDSHQRPELAQALQPPKWNTPRWAKRSRSRSSVSTKTTASCNWDTNNWKKIPGMHCRNTFASQEPFTKERNCCPQGRQERYRSAALRPGGLHPNRHPQQGRRQAGTGRRNCSLSW